MKKYTKHTVQWYLAVLAFLGLVILACDNEDYTELNRFPAQEQHTISEITPSIGDIGTTVVITGTNFSPVPANNKVSFGSIRASVTAATETELSVVVPEGTTTGSIFISKAQFDTEGPVFTVIAAPVITELSATGAAIGETIIISGQNFGATITENTVRFNGVEAEITAASVTELTVIIPDDATTGPLTVEVLGQLGTVEVFTIAPIIVSFNPIRGTANDEIVLTGTNFNPLTINNNVSFNGVLAEVVSASTTELRVLVPPQANLGRIAIEIEQLLALSAEDFITVPSVTSFNPSFGAPNDEVMITGTNFSAVPLENTVLFNGVAATVVESTETTLTVLVPEGSETGPITVELNEETGTSETDFMVDNSLITVTSAINDENDDVEEAEDGRMSLDSSDLELGEFDTASTPDLGLQKIGLRFTNVSIPAGVTIETASIEFVADQTEGANPTEMTIFGENIGNAAAYTEDLNNLSDRMLTSASSIWNIPEWIGSDTPIADRTTVDISGIITEIIARSDWVEGNSMNFVFEATGVSAGATANNVGREAETYDVDNPEEGAKLTITYRIN